MSNRNLVLMKKKIEYFQILAFHCPLSKKNYFLENICFCVLVCVFISVIGKSSAQETKASMSPGSVGFLLIKIHLVLPTGLPSSTTSREEALLNSFLICLRSVKIACKMQKIRTKSNCHIWSYRTIVIS